MRLLIKALNRIYKRRGAISLRRRLIQLANRMLLIAAVYLATVLLIFTVGLAAGRAAAYWQVAASLALLIILIEVLQRTKLGEDDCRRPIRVFPRHLLIFVLAMVVRSVFIGVFNYPAEKVPVIYLVLLTAFWAEGRSRRRMGISGDRAGRRLLAGLVLGVTYYFLSQLIYIGGAPTLLGVSPRLVTALQSGYMVVWVIITSFLLSALSEEILFRGYLQGGAERVMGPNKSLIYSAFLFGVWHTAWGISYVRDPAFASIYAVSYMAFTGLSGIVLGVAYRSTGNLILPIMIHGTWNTFASLMPLSSASPFFLQDPWRLLSFGLVVLLLYFAVSRTAKTLKIGRR